MLANVQGSMNAVMVQGDAVGSSVYYGAGAGELPTASAVVADLVDVARLMSADHVHRVPYLAFQQDAMADTPVLPMSQVLSYRPRSEEHTSELHSRGHLVCRLLLEKKKKIADTLNKNNNM